MANRDLDHLLVNASLPFERLALIDRGLPIAPAALDARLNEWAAALDPRAQSAAVDRFRAWQGLSPNAAHRAIAAELAWPPDAPQPSWLDTLRCVLDLPPRLDLNPAPASAFEEALSPFIDCFRQRLDQSPGVEVLTAPARQSLAAGLLARLSMIAAPTLYARFDVFRSQANPIDPAAPSRSIYAAFIRTVQGDGLAGLCAEYPMLARLLAVQTDLWSAAQIEFLGRLNADVPALEHAFGPTGPVTALWPGQSDPHHGGRTVCGVQFESGLRLIYKPKPLGIAVAYHRLLDWLRTRDPNLDLRALRVLPREHYGWVEYAAHQPCADAAAVQRYFYRMGLLLSVVYLLGGSDSHSENIMACGEYPVLIDEETLLRPLARLNVPADIRRSAVYRVSAWLGTSVLSTHILPAADARKPRDITALGAYADQTAAPLWLALNTDAMTPNPHGAQPSPINSLPFLADEVAPLDTAAASAVVQGFDAMTHFWLAHRAELLAPGGPLDAFRGQAVRFIFRSTNVYALLQTQVCQPRYLRDAVSFGLYLERLARVHLTPSDKPAGWPILAAERAACYQLDVPLFNAYTDQATLWLDDGTTLPDYFTTPSLVRVLDRLSQLDEAEIARQRELVRQSVCLPQFLRADEVQQTDRVLRAALEPPPSAIDFVQRAITLGQDLDRQAMWGEDGSACWPLARFERATQRFRHAPLEVGVYAGLAGVMLFLAALEPAWPGARCLRAGAWQALRIDLNDFDNLVREFGVGGGTGLGSLLYALTRLGSPDVAHALAVRLTREHLRASPLDVLSGVAGAALGLLAVHAAAPQPDLLERAVWCGQILLDKRTAKGAWPTGLHGELLGGFAHGTAGIALALLRLYAATGQSDFLEAAQSAIDYDNSLFLDEEQNWQDLRGTADPASDHSGGDPTARCGTAWCVGAVGIGLARLSGLSMLDTPAIRRDIERAVLATQASLARRDYLNDHLCCGALGQVELLLAVGQRLNRPDLIEEARQAAARVIGRADRLGHFVLAHPNDPLHVNPTFYRGTAGLGYQLLRLAQPERLPSILMFE